MKPKPRLRTPRLNAARRGRAKLLALGVLVCLVQGSAYAEAAQPSLTYLIPGGSFYTATLITPGAYANTQAFSASHFFKLLLSRGTTLAAMVQPSPSGDLDLYLYDCFRQGVTNSTMRQLGATEQTQFTTEVAGYCYLEVRYVSGQPDYTLMIDISALEVVAADWGTAASPVEAAPGDLGVPLTVKVRNQNNFTITDITATLFLNGGFANASGGDTALAHCSLLVQPAQTFDLTFTLSLASSTALGVHLLPVTVRYYSTSTTTSTTTTSTTSNPSRTETSTTSTSTPSTTTVMTAGLPFNLTVPVQVSGRPTFQFVLSDLFLKPGSSTPLTLAVRNLGTAPASSVELTLSLPPPLALEGSGNRWSLGTILPGVEVEVPVSLYAASSTQGSTFQVAATVAYRSVTGFTRTETQTLAVIVLTPSDIQFVVLTEDRPLTAGDYGNVTVTVVNNGSTPASSVDVTFTPPPPLSLAGKDNRWFVHSLAPGEAFAFQAAVWAPYASQGQSYTATVAISYRTTEGVAKTDVRGGIGLFVRSAAEAGPVLSLSLESADLFAGQVNDIHVTVSNEGASPANSLLVTLSTPPGTTIMGRSNRWFIPKVDAGEKVSLPLRLYASPQGIGSDSPATVTVKYRDSRGNDITETSSIGFTVRGFIDLYVMNIVTSPSPPIAGRSLIVSGSLLNEGSITAKAVNVSLSVNAEGIFTAGLGSSHFVGEAPVGLQTPFSINVLVASNATDGTYSLPLEIAFRNDRNEPRRLTAIVTLRVVTETASQPSPETTSRGSELLRLVLLAVAAFIVGLLLGILLQRRMKRPLAEQPAS